MRAGRRPALRALAVASLAAAVVSVAACSKSPAFVNTDISGADFGADFRLTDHKGKPRTLADFRGKVVAIFFGYTQCPDVCPTTLSDMAETMRRLGGDADRVQVLFVTVDPERDTTELLSRYVPAFDPRFIGLRSDPETTAKVAKDFKVFYQKVPGSSPDVYGVDHSAATYLYDTHGRIRLFAKHGVGPDAFVHDIRMLLAEK
ncbi:MAG: SCO family protein [Burkholderiaceae bacterium]